MTTATLPEGVRLCGNDVRWYKRPIGFISPRESGFCIGKYFLHHHDSRVHPLWGRCPGCYRTEADAVQALIDNVVDYDAHRASTKTQRFPRYSR